MYDFDARDLIPFYASIEPEDYVRHYEPKKSYIKPEKVTRKNFGPDAASNEPLRMKAGKFFRDLWKKGIAFWAAVTFYTVFVCCITGVIVRNNTVIEVREQIKAEEDAAKQAEEQAKQGSGILVDEDSKNAAIDFDKGVLGRIGQGLRDTYPSADASDVEKAMWCCVFRVYSNGEFGEFGNIHSIYDAATQKDQWWGLKDNMVIETEIDEIALKVSTAFHNSETTPCSKNMVYASWDSVYQDLVLRDKWTDNSSARHY